MSRATVAASATSKGSSCGSAYGWVTAYATGAAAPWISKIGLNLTIVETRSTTSRCGGARCSAKTARANRDRDAGPRCKRDIGKCGECAATAASTKIVRTAATAADAINIVGRSEIWRDDPSRS
jgi:hypothetical protein